MCTYIRTCGIRIIDIGSTYTNEKQVCSMCAYMQVCVPKWRNGLSFHDLGLRLEIRWLRLKSRGLAVGRSGGLE